MPALLAAAWPWTRDKAAPWVWAHRSLVMLLVIGALASGLAWSCHVGCAAERRTGAAQEGAHAAATGTAIVPTTASDPDLVAERDRLFEENAALAQGERDLRAALGADRRLQVRWVVKGSASGKVDAPPRPPDPPGSPPAVPVLAQGDVLDLELEGVGLQGPKGSQLALATVAARRASDKALLLRKLLAAPATQLSVDEGIGGAPPAKATRDWRFGGQLGVTEDGVADGWRASALAARRLRLAGDDRQALLRLTVGPKRLPGGERGWSGEVAIGGLW